MINLTLGTFYFYKPSIYFGSFGSLSGTWKLTVSNKWKIQVPLVNEIFVWQFTIPRSIYNILFVALPVKGTKYIVITVFKYICSLT